MKKYEGKYQQMAEQFRRDGADEYTIDKWIRQEMESDQFHAKDGTTDIEAVKLWKTYPEKAKNMWLNNALCGTCGLTSFKPGYNLRKDRFGVVIQGNCAKCGRRIARACD